MAQLEHKDAHALKVRIVNVQNVGFRGFPLEDPHSRTLYVTNVGGVPDLTVSNDTAKASQTGTGLIGLTPDKYKSNKLAHAGSSKEFREEEKKTVMVKLQRLSSPDAAQKNTKYLTTDKLTSKKKIPNVDFKKGNQDRPSDDVETDSRTKMFKDGSSLASDRSGYKHKVEEVSSNGKPNPKFKMESDTLKEKNIAKHQKKERGLSLGKNKLVSSNKGDSSATCGPSDAAIEPNYEVSSASQCSDMAFYKSTLPILKTFNTSQKLQFRIEYLQLLQKYVKPDKS